MIHESVYELRKDIKNAVKIEHGKLEVVDAEALRKDKIDTLARDAAFGSPAVKAFAQWVIWEAGQALGARPASIHEFYISRIDDTWSDRTVPAMNIRFTAYDTTRAALRAAKKTNAGALIFEIARSEMGYCDLPPAEFGASIIAAAIKEGYYHPLFIQGDHFQVKASKFAKDPDGAIQEVKDLIAEAIPAGYWNIDIDTSTLVDLSKGTLSEQQYNNFMRSAEITKFIRSIEPEGVTLSLGGEIGEVGHKNSTVEELDAFMQGYRREVGEVAGISKISVQTGTSHGGVVLPDGTLADVSVDFETLRDLSRVARESYGMGGAVQHGASTLPANAFGKFPEVGTVEIHLATNFMNIVFDLLPADLLDQAYAYVRSELANEWKPGMTEEQFIYSSRKRAVGKFKAEWWHMDVESQQKIADALQTQFEFLFDQLNVKETLGVVRSLTTMVQIHKERPLAAVAEAEAEDVSDLAD